MKLSDNCVLIVMLHTGGRKGQLAGGGGSGTPAGLYKGVGSREHERLALYRLECDMRQ